MTFGQKSKSFCISYFLSIPNKVLRMMPKLAESASDTFSFWPALIRELQGVKVQSGAHGTHDPGLENLIDSCLKLLRDHCVEVINEEGCQEMMFCVMQLLELSIVTKRAGHWEPLLASVLAYDKISTEAKLSSIYIPLLQRFTLLLQRDEFDDATSAFDNFRRTLVGQCLHDFLGEKPKRLSVKLRKLGCDCDDCEAVNAHMEGPKLTKSFPLAKARRSHVEERIGRMPDLISFTIDPDYRPYHLVITKTEQLSALIRWELRAARAKSFLSEIGDEECLNNLTGSQYPEIAKALSGEQLFLLPLNIVADGEPGDTVDCQVTAAEITKDSPDATRVRDWQCELQKIFLLPSNVPPKESVSQLSLYGCFLFDPHVAMVRIWTLQTNSLRSSKHLKT